MSKDSEEGLLQRALPYLKQINHRAMVTEASNADISNLCDNIAAFLSTPQTGEGWMPVSDSPKKDGFYLCFTKCPPQSHPVQAIRFKDGEWFTSWPVVSWRPLPLPPADEKGE